MVSSVVAVFSSVGAAVSLPPQAAMDNTIQPARISARIFFMENLSFVLLQKTFWIHHYDLNPSLFVICKIISTGFLSCSCCEYDISFLDKSQ